MIEKAPHGGFVGADIFRGVGKLQNQIRSINDVSPPSGLLPGEIIFMHFLKSTFFENCTDKNPLGGQMFFKGVGRGSVGFYLDRPVATPGGVADYCEMPLYGLMFRAEIT